MFNDIKKADQEIQQLKTRATDHKARINSLQSMIGLEEIENPSLSPELLIDCNKLCTHYNNMFQNIGLLIIPAYLTFPEFVEKLCTDDIMQLEVIINDVGRFCKHIKHISPTEDQKNLLVDLIESFYHFFLDDIIDSSPIELRYLAKLIKRKQFEISSLPLYFMARVIESDIQEDFLYLHSPHFDAFTEDEITTMMKNFRQFLIISIFGDQHLLDFYIDYSREILRSLRKAPREILTPDERKQLHLYLNALDGLNRESSEYRMYSI